MDETSRQLSFAVEGVARALAEWTVCRHLEQDEHLPEKYGPSWRRRWVTETEHRIRYLAQAIAVGRSQLFTESLARAGAAYEALDVAVADLLENLRCLREVIEAELPGAAARIATGYIDAALAHGADDALEPDDVGVTLDQPRGELVLRYLEALLSGRRREAEQIVLDAVEAGMSIRDAHEQVLHRAQVEIGRMWHQSEISIADEHFATQTAESVIARLRDRFETAPRRGRRIVTTAVAGDLHAIGVRTVSEFFEMDGWDVICLGANTPQADAIRSVRDYEADVLAVSSSSFLHVRSVGELIAALRGEPDLGAVRVIVGGIAFNRLTDLWKDLGADGFAPNASAAVDLANRLVEPAAT